MPGERLSAHSALRILRPRRNDAPEQRALATWHELRGGEPRVEQVREVGEVAFTIPWGVEPRDHLQQRDDRRRGDGHEKAVDVDEDALGERVP